MRYVDTLTISDEKYPMQLRNILNPPKVLYCEGDISLLSKPSVTVIGSRNMSEYGNIMARNITRDLTKNNICIVSGMAVGIDAVAHKTCIENNGKTIAVLGSGFDHVFPKENKGLFKKIISSGGCVVSEYAPDTVAQKRFFPERNRIVSGLSMGTVVVEATYRSGTSITAHYALDQGKKVFCVPNCVGSKNSAGIINMLKKGAIIATTGSDILYELGWLQKSEFSENFEQTQEKKKLQKIEILEQEELKNLDEQAKQIYFYIKENKIVNPEVISNELKMSIQKMNVYLTILELKGLIINKSGVNYSIREELYV